MQYDEYESGLFVPPLVDLVAKEDYEQLLEDAHKLGQNNDVSLHHENKAFWLIRQLGHHDSKTAKESLQTLPLAIDVGVTIGEFYQTDPNTDAIWTASVLHDIGKLTVPKPIIDISNEGKIWNDRHRGIMKRHPLTGARILRSEGMPEVIARPVEEHHHRQYGCASYGRESRLNNAERIVRDSIAAADFTDAAINRTNSRNVNMTRLERENEVGKNLKFLFVEYERGEELADKIAVRLLGRQILQSI
jgi:putative nucleotidyltransferase with HDIG domain